MTAATIKELTDQQAGLKKKFLTEPVSGRTLSYSEMKNSAADIQNWLTEAGFTKGSKVAIALENGIEAAICILGVMYSGGVVVPVNLGWKAKEISYILKNSDSSFLISTKKIMQETGLDAKEKRIFRKKELRLLCLNLENSGQKEEKQVKELSAEDLALLLYTSGTTGAPKGVMLTHKNLLAEAEHIQRGHKLVREDKGMQVLPLFHINGLVIGFLTPFFTGQELIMPPKFSVSHFWEWIEKYQVTWLSAVPTILSMILSRTPADYKGASSLKFMRSASAPLPEAVLNEFETRFHVPVIESFGISEGASQITVNPIDGVRKPGSAGIAIGNEVQIVDEKEQVLGVDQTGEVRVRGDNIFCGYYHLPDETGKSLRDGWFYTGDLGWMDQDGYLFLKGRKKELINRAGEKFSPREIDELLYQIPDIELAAAVGVPDPLYNEEVVAFIKVREGSTLTEQEILDYCKGKLADFKLPKEILFTEDFPKGPSGKIQRLKLRNEYEERKKKRGEQYEKEA